VAGTAIQLLANASTSDCDLKDRPIFVNFLLADEINRAPAKVQATPRPGRSGRGVQRQRPRMMF